jgi:hypothetical protein
MKDALGIAFLVFILLVMFVGANYKPYRRASFWGPQSQGEKVLNTALGYIWVGIFIVGVIRLIFFT